MKKTILAFVLLTAMATQSFAQTGDPWIKKVYNDTWGRNPTAIEYNINNYNNGHWNSYGELMKYIYEFQKNINSAGITFKYSQKYVGNNALVVGIFQKGSQIAADIISQDGGSIIAQGGGNIISYNGGSVIAQGGGNIIAQGGGNIAVSPATKGAFFGSAYTLQADGTTVVKTSSSGALIIR